MEIPIGQCRKKGQSKKTTSALNKQDDGLPLSSDTSSSTSDESDPSTNYNFASLLLKTFFTLLSTSYF